jgi:hypothetical protein
MSFENPTRLRIGMHGQFSGRDYRVVGRVVMGEAENGEVYYWNEFNLETHSGESATLVYEGTESGGQWRLFNSFEPEFPMTAADAGTKQVGDPLNLTGNDVRVTFRGTSRVYQIEGEAPEGVKVGGVAEYFNAEAGDLMQVVSWTGDEVEYYDGTNLAREFVATAFNLPLAAGDLSGFAKLFPNSSDGSGENYTSGLKFSVQLFIVLLVFLAIFGPVISVSTDRESGPVQKLGAGPAPLDLGTTGRLNGRIYHVAAHAVVEIRGVGEDFERHEYELADEDGNTRFLVCGLKPAAPQWLLLDPLVQLQPPRPQECAAMKIGDLVNVDGFIGIVQEDFMSTVEVSEGTPVLDWQRDNVEYGYIAESGYNSLITLWNNRDLSFARGTNILANSVKSAFGKP